MMPEEAPRSLLKAILGSQADVKISPEEMVERLQDQGWRIEKEDPAAPRKHSLVVQPYARWEGGYTLKFAVVSDTQLGSRKQQLTFLNQCYDRFVDRGITEVFHAGDLVDGDGRVYPGQQYDLFVHGYKRQLEYVAAHYPKRKEIMTHVISGNHDWSFWQRGGADIIAALAEKRDDILYLGSKSALVTMTPKGAKEGKEQGGVSIQLMHPKSGLTYARSYRLQKIIEQMAPATKPDMMFAGDKHSWAHVPMYRNVDGWSVGCFQAQTDYEKALGLYPEIGALIVEVDYGTKGADRREQRKPGHEGRVSMVAVRWEILPMYVPLEDDY